MKMETETSNISNVCTENSNNEIPGEIWKPDVIVLGPGGAKGYLELGALYKLEQVNFFSDVSVWLGCSIGSAIALLKVSGYSATEIINDCININLVNDITDINIDRITESPGLFNNKTIEKLLELRIKQRFGMIPTLLQLFMATGYVLAYVTFNLDKMRVEVLTKDSNPELSCIKGSMMSMAAPLLIKPIIYRGNVYVDGAIGDPYPILIYDNGENNILGIYIHSEHSSHSSDKKFFRYIYRCAQASMKVLRDQHIEWSSDKCLHLALKTPVTDTTGLTLDHKYKMAMIDSGYKSAALFLLRLKDPVKYQVLLDDNEEIPPEEDIITGDGVLDGVLDEEITHILDALSNDEFVDEFVDESSLEDIYVSDFTGSDEDTLMIPMTQDFRRNIQRVWETNRN